MSQITDMARYRAARQRPATDLCRWSEAFEKIATTNVRMAFAWQRGILRYLFGALIICGLAGCAVEPVKPIEPPRERIELAPAACAAGLWAPGMRGWCRDGREVAR